jgi:hypothetical protein
MLATTQRALSLAAKAVVSACAMRSVDVYPAQGLLTRMPYPLSTAYAYVRVECKWPHVGTVQLVLTHDSHNPDIHHQQLDDRAPARNLQPIR